MTFSPSKYNDTLLGNRMESKDSLVSMKKILIALGALVLALVIVYYSLVYMNQPLNAGSNKESPTVLFSDLNESKTSSSISASSSSGVLDPVPSVLGPNAATQASPGEKSKLIMFLLKKSIYSIDPKDDELFAKKNSNCADIFFLGQIYYDAENAYFQGSNNRIHKVKINGDSTETIFDEVELADSFSFCNSTNMFYFIPKVSGNLNELQGFNSQINQFTNRFGHLCDNSISYPQIILNSNDGSKLFYKCISNVGIDSNSVVIDNLNNPNNQELHRIRVTINERFILSPDDKYVIIFSERSLKIVDITKNVEIVKSIDLNLNLNLYLSLSFSGNGRYLYIISSLSSTYSLTTIDFTSILGYFETKNVDLMRNVEASHIETKIIKMPAENIP